MSLFLSGFIEIIELSLAALLLQLLESNGRKKMIRHLLTLVFSIGLLSLTSATLVHASEDSDGQSSQTDGDSSGDNGDASGSGDFIY